MSWRRAPFDRSRHSRPPHLHLGRRGERATIRALRRKGYRLVARNYTCDCGEIDIVAFHDGVLVFVEVKTRAGEEHEDACDVVRDSQWRRIEHTARHFMARYNLCHYPARFDLITLIWPAHSPPIVEQIQGAFHPRRP